MEAQCRRLGGTQSDRKGVEDSGLLRERLCSAEDLEGLGIRQAASTLVRRKRV